MIPVRFDHLPTEGKGTGLSWYRESALPHGDRGWRGRRNEEAKCLPASLGSIQRVLANFLPSAMVVNYVDMPTELVVQVSAYYCEPTYLGRYGLKILNYKPLPYPVISVTVILQPHPLVMAKARYPLFSLAGFRLRAVFQADI